MVSDLRICGRKTVTVHAASDAPETARSPPTSRSRWVSCLFVRPLTTRPLWPGTCSAER